MEQSIGLIFHLKKTRNTEQWLLPVYMRITVDGLYCEISTKRKSKAAIWNQQTGRQVSKTQHVKQFNAYLDTLQQKVYKAKRKLIELDKPLSAVNIKNELLGKNIDRRRYMLLEIFRKHNEQITVLVNRDFAPGNYRTIHYFIQSY
jgi:hypothetical protein